MGRQAGRLGWITGGGRGGVLGESLGFLGGSLGDPWGVLGDLWVAPQNIRSPAEG